MPKSSYICSHATKSVDKTKSRGFVGNYTGRVDNFSYCDRESLSEYLQSSVGRQLQEGSASKIIPLVQCWTSEGSSTDRK